MKGRSPIIMSLMSPSPGNLGWHRECGGVDIARQEKAEAMDVSKEGRGEERIDGR